MLNSEQEAKLFNLLNGFLGRGILLKKGEALFNDPFSNHYKPKLAVNLRTQAWHSWIVTKERGKTIYGLLKKLNASQEVLSELNKILPQKTNNFCYKNEKSKKFLKLPDEYKPLYKKNHDIEYKHALRYALSRGLTKYDIIKYNIGYCIDGKYKNRLILPSYDENFNLNFFTSRLFFKGKLSYLNCEADKNAIIGYESFISWKFPIVICEGAFDAIAIKRNSIPLYGYTLGDGLLYKILNNNVRDVYLALDSDAKQSIINITEKMLNENINVYLVNMPKKDPSTLGFKNMMKLISKSTLMDFSKLMKLKMT